LCDHSTLLNGKVADLSVALHIELPVLDEERVTFGELWPVHCCSQLRLQIHRQEIETDDVVFVHLLLSDPLDVPHKV